MIYFQLHFNASIHPRGVLYNKSNEGSLYNDNEDVSSGDSVPPNGTYTYKWTVPDSVSPTNQDTPCIAWLYESSVDPVKDPYTGNSISLMSLSGVFYKQSIYNHTIFLLYINQRHSNT